MFYWSYSWHPLLAGFLQELSTQQIFLTGRQPNRTGWRCMQLIMVLSHSTLPSKSTLKWRTWMTMPLSPLSLSITPSSWKTPQRMYLSFRSKPRTLTPAPMKSWLTGLQVEIPRTSSWSIPKQVTKACCLRAVGKCNLHIYQLSLLQGALVCFPNLCFLVAYVSRASCMCLKHSALHRCTNALAEDALQMCCCSNHSALGHWIAAGSCLFPASTGMRLCCTVSAEQC